MARDAVTLISSEEIILLLAENLHKDLCKLQSALIKRNEHAIGNYIESAVDRSHELTARLRESTVVS